MSAVLPQGWANTTLGDLIEPRRVKVNPQATPTAEFVGLEHVEAHTTKLLGTTSAAAMRSSASTFKQSDVLYGRLRPYLNKVCQPDFDGLCSGEFVVMPENQAVSGAFLKHRLNAQDFVEFASHLNAGDRPRVDFSQLRPFALTLPPKKEQTRIADTLAKLFDQLDAGIDTLQRCQEKLARYRASVLRAAVQGDLTAAWRKEHPDVEPASNLLQRILAERRRRWEQEQLRSYAEKGKTPPKNWKAKYKEPVGPPPDATSLPRSWCWATVGQCASAIEYGSSAKAHADSTGAPVLRMGNISPDGQIVLDDLKYLPASHPALASLRLRTGDLLFNRTNSSDLVGKTAIYSGEPPLCTFASYLIQVRPLAGLRPRFLMYALNGPLGRRWIKRVASQTVGQANVNGTKLAAFTFPLPPLAEQDAAIAAAQTQLSAIDDAETDVGSKVKKAGLLRQSILQSAFTGNLLPQDPSDEPASKLLERIASEREARQRQKPKHHRV